MTEEMVAKISEKLQAIPLPPLLLVALQDYHEKNQKIAAAYDFPKIEISPEVSRAFVEIGRVASALQEKWNAWAKPMQQAALEFQRRMDEIAAPAREFARRMEEMNAPIRSMVAAAQKQLNTPGIRAMFTSFKLQSRFWIVSDIDLFREIIDREIESEHALEQFLVSYYTANNWAAVNALLDKWQAAPSLAPRVAIIEDCLKTVQLAQGKNLNIANVVIPTLIAQIDGMMADLYKLILGNAPMLPSNKKADKHEVVMELVSQIVNVRAADMLHTVIIEGVFRHADAIKKSRAANDNQQSAEFNIFRHKIMHGDRDFLNYGTTENLTRFFLYADFLIQLITKIENGQSMCSRA